MSEATTQGCAPSEAEENKENLPPHDHIIVVIDRDWDMTMSEPTITMRELKKIATRIEGYQARAVQPPFVFLVCRDT